MSQHNIIGSEAFDRRPFVLIRSYRVGGIRRRRASTTLAYGLVALVALIIGAVVVALVMGPKLAEAEALRGGLTTEDSRLSAPAVPGSSASAVPTAEAPVAVAVAPVVAAPAAAARPAPRPRPVARSAAPAATETSGPVAYEAPAPAPAAAEPQA